MRRRLILAGLVCIDILATVFAVIAATLIRFRLLEPPIGLHGVNAGLDLAALLLAVVALTVGFMAFEHLYDLDSLFWGSGEFSRVVRVATFVSAALVLALYAFKAQSLSRIWLVVLWVLLCMALAAGRAAARVILARARARRLLFTRTLIVGCNDDAERIAKALRSAPSSGFEVVGCLSANQGAMTDPQAPSGTPLVGSFDQVDSFVQTGFADAVVIISSAFGHQELSTIVSKLRRLHADIYVCSGLDDVLASRVVVREVAGAPIIKVRGTMLSPVDLASKRAFDIAFSSLVIALGMPVWLLVAAAIKLDSPGPVFYRQTRIGKDGRVFGMFKFRSMCVDAEARLKTLSQLNEADGPLFKMRVDPRVTKVGKWLRRYSIDEFPQLINVLLGDMSVVGPRPPLEAEVEEYSAHHSRRLEVVPGMTGLWQVSGRSDLTFDEMVRLDMYYIENWSLRYDIMLILRTVPAILAADGAY